MLLAAFEATAYAQEFNVFNLWARETTNQHILGFDMPVTWYPSFDGMFIVVLIPLCMRYWDWQVRRGKATTELTKIGWSGLMGATGMLALTAASILAAGGGKPGMGWGIFCFAAFALGFIYNWPTAMALCSRVAPPAIGGIIMGLLFLTSAVSNYLGGWLGAYYETMSHAAFWGLHAAISAAGAVLVLIFYRPLTRILGAPKIGVVARGEAGLAATIEE
jgi:POT family proton-dependent oligopeptide transporter